MVLRPSAQHMGLNPGKASVKTFNIWQAGMITHLAAPLKTSSWKSVPLLIKPASSVPSCPHLWDGFQITSWKLLEVLSDTSQVGKLTSLRPLPGVGFQSQENLFGSFLLSSLGHQGLQCRQPYWAARNPGPWEVAKHPSIPIPHQSWE